MTAPGAASTSDVGVIDLLSRGDLRPLGLMPKASNHTFLAQVNEGERTTLAVYKPRAGEAPLWDFPEGTLCGREVAAYELARALGWPSIPPTVLRDGPYGPGSVQLFVEADPREHFFTLRETRLEAFKPIAMFDALVNNADRKAGHCLLDPAGAIWVVDHGVCFNEDPKLRTVIWDFAGQRIPRHLLADLEGVAGELEAGSLHATLLELLAPTEVEATVARVEEILRSRRFPHPGPFRPFPWPPV